MGNINPTFLKLSYNTYSLGGVSVIDFVDYNTIAIIEKSLNKPIFVYKLEPQNKSNILKKTFNNGYLGKYKNIYFEESLLTEDLLISSSSFK